MHYIGANGFQSTLPARGATSYEVKVTLIKDISIHAPREGSDADATISGGKLIEFQSTLPARGATRDYYEPKEG